MIIERILFIKSQLDTAAQLFEKIGATLTPAIGNTADEMITSLRQGGKLLICGNGGSAADAQHFAAEMVVRLSRNRGALPAIALSTDTSILTAISNDFSFDMIFRRQVEALGRTGDALIVLSTSGNSKNVLQAVLAAKEIGLRTIGLLGKGGGEIAKVANEALIVPGNDAQHVQEAHIAIIHIWCALIEDALFPPSDPTVRTNPKEAPSPNGSTF